MATRSDVEGAERAVDTVSETPSDKRGETG